MVAMNPVDRMDFPGLGLDNVDHRVLTYKQLVAAKPNPDPRKPTRLKEIHLTANMERYMWSFDGQKFDAVTDKPIRFAFNWTRWGDWAPCGCSATWATWS
jgi:FtsP/CotA-like multicopper oxidase with cupredoxin domain